MLENSEIYKLLCNLNNNYKACNKKGDLLLGYIETFVHKRPCYPSSNIYEIQKSYNSYLDSYYEFSIFRINILIEIEIKYPFTIGEIKTYIIKESNNINSEKVFRIKKDRYFNIGQERTLILTYIFNETGKFKGPNGEYNPEDFEYVFFEDLIEILKNTA